MYDVNGQLMFHLDGKTNTKKRAHDMNPLRVLPSKPEAKQLPHTYCTAPCPFLPGHAQAGEPLRDDEDVQTREGVDPQDRVSCSQALR